MFEKVCHMVEKRGIKCSRNLNLKRFFFLVMKVVSVSGVVVCCCV